MVPIWSGSEDLLATCDKDEKDFRTNHYAGAPAYQPRTHANISAPNSRLKLFTIS
jgi:hypothetical protein